MFVDDCRGFYSFVGRRAVPRGEQPQFEPAVAALLPRAIERQLQPYGVVRVEAHPQWPIAMQAAETLAAAVGEHAGPGRGRVVRQLL